MIMSQCHILLLQQFSDLLQLEMEKMLVKEFVLSSSAELETQRKKGKLRYEYPLYLVS